MYLAEGYLYADLIAARPRYLMHKHQILYKLVKVRRQRQSEYLPPSTIKQSDMQLINISRSIQALPRKGAKVEEIPFDQASTGHGYAYPDF